MNNDIVFKDDARSVKTRNAIKTALMELLKTKNINEIGVVELTELAHRNRNSFYTHYKCIEDVLTDITQDVVNNLNKIIRKFTIKDFLSEPRPLLNELGSFIQSHRKVAMSLASLTCSVDIFDKMKRKFYQQILSCSVRQYGEKFKLVDYAISFFVSGCIDMYYNWVLNADVSLDELTDTLIGFVKNGFKSIQKRLGC